MNISFRKPNSGSLDNVYPGTFFKFNGALMQLAGSDEDYLGNLPVIVYEDNKAPLMHRLHRKNQVIPLEMEINEQ